MEQEDKRKRTGETAEEKPAAEKKTKKGRRKLPKTPAFVADGLAVYDNWLVAILYSLYEKALGARPTIGRICKYIYQVGGVVLAIWAYTTLSKILAVSTDAEYVTWVAQGLFGQVTELGYYNAALTTAFTLLVAFGIGAALSFNKALYLMDLALLCMIFYGIVGTSQVFVMLSTTTVVILWILFRLIFGSIAVFYKKDQQLKLRAAKMED